MPAPVLVTIILRPAVDDQTAPLALELCCGIHTEHLEERVDAHLSASSLAAVPRDRTAPSLAGPAPTARVNGLTAGAATPVGRSTGTIVDSQQPLATSNLNNCVEPSSRAVSIVMRVSRATAMLLSSGRDSPVDLQG